LSVTPFLRGLDDVRRTFGKAPVIVYLAISDTKARYIRSLIGPFWPVLGNAIGILGLGAVWTALLGLSASQYIPSLAVGLVIWQLISGCISDSPGLIGRKAMIIRNIEFPLTFFPLSTVAGHLVNFTHSLLIVIAVFLIYPQPTTPTLILISVAGLILTLVNLLWFATILAIVGARYRDVEPAIISSLPLLFLLSPVLFRAEQLPFGASIIWFNPVTYAITAIREPLLGMLPNPSIYAGLAVTALMGWTLMLAVVGKWSKRVPFWI